MTLQIQRKSYVPSEDHTWLGSRHGTDAPDPITLDGAACLAKFPDGVVKSGIHLTKLGTGLYAPAIKGAVDGTQVVAGVLFTTKFVLNGASADNTPAALLWHCEVVAAKVPTYASSYVAADFPLGSALQSNLLIRWV